jgi:hypothetical protein
MHLIRIKNRENRPLGGQMPFSPSANKSARTYRV